MGYLYVFCCLRPEGLIAGWVLGEEAPVPWVLGEEAPVPSPPMVGVWGAL